MFKNVSKYVDDCRIRWQLIPIVLTTVQIRSMVQNMLKSAHSRFVKLSNEARHIAESWYALSDQTMFINLHVSYEAMEHAMR